MRRPSWFERLMLRGFDPEEVDDIIADLQELASERGAFAGRFYYWRQLLSYPLRQSIEWIRAHWEGERTNRDGRGGMESFIRDGRYALRSLRRSPGFSVMAVAIMTLSMGSATAIFSVVDGVLLEPLPVEDPDRLVSLWLENSRGIRARMTPGNYTDIAELEGAFESVAAFGGETASLSLDEEAVFLRGSRVTSSYFETLGVTLLAGRSFSTEEAEAGGSAVVVLSHHVWQQMFGSDPEIIRRTIELDGGNVEVIGVAPPGVYPTQATVSAEIPFTASNQDFFVPLRYSSEAWQNRRSHLLGSIGRLAPGVSLENARARLGALSERLNATEPLNQNERILMTSFTDEVVGDVRFALLMLLGTVTLVLLIAVANVGALFVLRADDRQPELAIRVALGAPKRRLFRQMMLESVIVAAVASVVALLVAQPAISAMRRLVPYQIPRLDQVGIHGTALLVTVAVGVVVAVAFGLLPAMRLREDRLAGPVSATKQTSSARQRRLQSLVVGIQAALCIIVLVGAGLLTRSYANLRAVDTGFSARSAWTMSVPTNLSTLQAVVEEVRSLPGVAAAAIAYDHPLERNWGDSFIIEGVERAATDPPTSASLRPFGDGYFETVGIDVVDGRVPDRLDFAGDVGYAVINETLARTFFPNGSPIGQRIILPTAQRMLGDDGVFEISGVVADVRFMGPDQPVSPALYVPLSHFRVGASTLMIRPERADAPIIPAVRDVVSSIDPGLSVEQAQPLQSILNDLLARPRFNMMLLLSFAAIGLLLSGLGAYGLVGRVVSTRVREIGIQMALGADRQRLARMVVGSALKPIVVGGLIGVVAAVALGRVIQTLLFGVSPADPMSFVGSSTFLLFVGLVAAALPALRAVSIDPAAALRSD